MALPSWSRDLASLELLLRVAEHGSVGKAALAQGISQPAASTRLDRLERQTGLALLARSSTGSVLTPVGQAFSTWAREVLDAAQAMADGVAALRQTRSARLRIAASLTVAEYLMPAWLLMLRRGNPSLEVTAGVANSHAVCDRVLLGEVDIGLVEMPSVPTELSSMQLGVDRLVLVASPDYPAARSGTALRTRDLLDRPVLLREPGSGTRETFVRELARALGHERDLVLPHAVELGSTETILATARAGGGLGVISERAARADLMTGALVEVTVAGLHPVRPLNAVWLGRAPTPLAQLLIDLAQRQQQRGD